MSVTVANMIQARPIVDTFLGQSNTFWVAIGAMAAGIGGVGVLLTLWFIYLQLRTAAKSFELDAVCHLQDLIDAFRMDRAFVLGSYPLSIAVWQEQFPPKPPGRRHPSAKEDEAKAKSRALTEDQQIALRSLSEELKDHGRKVIEKLNDVGLLVEDGFVNKQVFFGKYHVMVIQCCHLVEALRREEEMRRGGNYGQRLLRMRHRATIYNDIWPKHRMVPIRITRDQVSRILIGEGRDERTADLSEQRIIYKSPQPTTRLRAMWMVRRWMHIY
jgi:hypothetical protein